MKASVDLVCKKICLSTHLNTCGHVVLFFSAEDFEMYFKEFGFYPNTNQGNKILLKIFDMLIVFSENYEGNSFV